MAQKTKYDSIVVKVGTSTLAHKGGLLNLRNMENIVKVLSDVKNMGVNVILVTSGAIGVGFGKLKIAKRLEDTPSKQAAAAVGQCELMYMYDKLFSEYGHTVAQILLTGDIVDDEPRRQNVANTFERLKKLGAIAVVNENDSVSVEEIEFGDNDTLSAMVAALTGAGALIILSDINGLYETNPKQDKEAKLIEDIYEIDDNIRKMAGGAGSALGTGGMLTKIRAAQTVNSVGIDMHIINGAAPELIYDVLAGKKCGTCFHGGKEKS